MSRPTYLGLAITVVLAGLLLRLVDWGLPLWVHHHAGGILWGAMLFLIVSALRPPGRDLGACLIASGMIAAIVEATRLFQSPGLDAFRATLAGQLLLGRIFSGWNLVAYAVGIGAAASLTRSAPTPEVGRRPLDRDRPPADPSVEEAPEQRLDWRA